MQRTFTPNMQHGRYRGRVPLYFGLTPEVIEYIRNLDESLRTSAQSSCVAFVSSHFTICKTLSLVVERNQLAFVSLVLHWTETMQSGGNAKESFCAGTAPPAINLWYKLTADTV